MMNYSLPEWMTLAKHINNWRGIARHWIAWLEMFYWMDWNAPLRMLGVFLSQSTKSYPLPAYRSKRWQNTENSCKCSIFPATPCTRKIKAFSSFVEPHNSKSAVIFFQQWWINKYNKAHCRFSIKDYINLHIVKNEQVFFANDDSDDGLRLTDRLFSFHAL